MGRNFAFNIFLYDLFFKMNDIDFTNYVDDNNDLNDVILKL